MATVYARKPAAAELQARRGFAWAIFAWLPVAIMCTAIAIESTHTFSAGHTTSWLRRIWQAIFGVVDNDRWDVIHHYIRKTGHFTGYGLLAATSLRAWLLTFARRLPNIPVAAWRWRSTLLALFLTTFVASCDEFHQSFMPDRTGTIWDVLLDTTGGAVFLCVIALLFFTRNRSAA